MGGADHGSANALFGLFDSRTPLLHSFQNRVGKRPAQIAEPPLLATINIFGDATGEGDDVRLALVLQWVEAQQRGSARADQGAAHCFEQAVGHVAHHPPHTLCFRHLACDELDARFGGEAPAGFLDAIHPAFVIERHDPRTDVDHSQVSNFAGIAHGNLRGAAANVDIHHACRLPDRACRRSGAECSQRRLQCITCAD